MPKHRPNVNSLAFIPKACPISGQSIPYNRIKTCLLVGVRTVMESPSATPMTRAVIKSLDRAVVARIREIRKSKIGTANRRITPFRKGFIITSLRLSEPPYRDFFSSSYRPQLVTFLKLRSQPADDDSRGFILVQDITISLFGA